MHQGSRDAAAPLQPGSPCRPDGAGERHPAVDLVGGRGGHARRPHPGCRGERALYRRSLGAYAVPAGRSVRRCGGWTPCRIRRPVQRPAARSQSNRVRSGRVAALRARPGSLPRLLRRRLRRRRHVSTLVSAWLRTDVRRGRTRLQGPLRVRWATAVAHRLERRRVGTDPAGLRGRGRAGDGVGHRGDAGHRRSVRVGPTGLRSAHGRRGGGARRGHDPRARRPVRRGPEPGDGTGRRRAPPQRDCRAPRSADPQPRGGQLRTHGPRVRWPTYGFTTLRRHGGGHSLDGRRAGRGGHDPGYQPRVRAAAGLGLHGRVRIGRLQGVVRRGSRRDVGDGRPDPPRPALARVVGRLRRSRGRHVSPPAGHAAGAALRREADGRRPPVGGVPAREPARRRDLLRVPAGGPPGLLRPLRGRLRNLLEGRAARRGRHS